MVSKDQFTLSNATPPSFTIAGEKYTAELTKLKEDSVNITVAGASSVFKEGDTKQFDVDNGGYKDISVTLSKIVGGRAEIVYKMLAKPVEEKKELPEEEIEKEEITEIKEEKSKTWIWLVTGSITIVIGLLGGYFYVKKKK